MAKGIGGPTRAASYHMTEGAPGDLTGASKARTRRKIPRIFLTPLAGADISMGLRAVFSFTHF